MRNVRFRLCGVLSTVLALACFVGCSDSDDKADTDEGWIGDPVIVGGLFSQSATSSAQVEGVRMAVRDVNEARIFDREFRVVALEFNDNSDRQAMTRELFDNHKAIAMSSEWSATALNTLNVTNDPTGGYSDFVNCSASSTNTVINDRNLADDPSSDFTYDSDKNDTLYRGVANDKKQASVVWGLVKEKSKTGIFYVDDAYGQSFRDEIRAKAAANNTPLVFDEPFPAEDITAAKVENEINTIISKNKQTSLTSLILVGLPNQGGPITKELTESAEPFVGQLVVTDGCIEATFFAPLAGAFTLWLAGAGNEIVGTAPENYAGTHSAAWTARLKSVVPGVDTTDAFVPSGADCTYAFILATIYANDAERFTAAGVKNHMGKLKASYYATLAADDIVEVTPDAAGLKAAKAAIEAGKKVKLNGASGIFVFDDDGDRMNQPYKSLQTEAEKGVFTWKRVSIFDGETGQCVQDC